MGMGPKSISHHQILPEIEGKQLVFINPLIHEGRLFLGGGYLGEVGWLTRHKSSDF